MAPMGRLNQEINSEKIDHLLLIWLDENVHRNENTYRTMKKFSSLFNNILTFNKFGEFLKYLVDEVSQPIVLILSHSFIHQISYTIHKFSRINSIYLFTETERFDVEEFKNVNKVQGVFSDIDSLCADLEKKESLKIKYPYTFTEEIIIPEKSNPSNVQRTLDFNELDLENLRFYFATSIEQSYSETVCDVNYENETCCTPLRISLEHSKTVTPYQNADDIDEKNGICPNIWWIIKDQADVFKMVAFDRIKAWYNIVKLIETMHEYLQNDNKTEHFLVICEADQIEEHLLKVSRNDNVRQIYLHFSVEKMRGCEQIIKLYSTIIKIVRNWDSLVHMILEDLSYYSQKRAQFYQTEGKIKLAKFNWNMHSF